MKIRLLLLAVATGLLVALCLAVHRSAGNGDGFQDSRIMQIRQITA